MDRTIDDRYTNPCRYSSLDGFDKLSLTDDQIKEEQEIFIKRYKRNPEIQSEYIDEALKITNFFNITRFLIKLRNEGCSEDIIHEIEKIKNKRFYEEYSEYWYKNNFKFED